MEMFAIVGGDLNDIVALRWWICPLVPPDTCATIRCLTLEDWQMSKSYGFGVSPSLNGVFPSRKSYVFFGGGVGYKRLTMISTPERSSAGTPDIFGAETMSLYHPLAFSDLGVGFFVPLNF